MNREEFKRMALRKIGRHNSGILEDAEPFWIPEVRDGWQANCFAAVWIEMPNSGGYAEFWNWCNEFLTKSPLCFYSDRTNKLEWWGFNTEEDMMLFLLRWA